MPGGGCGYVGGILPIKYCHSNNDWRRNIYFPTGSGQGSGCICPQGTCDCLDPQPFCADSGAHYVWTKDGYIPWSSDMGFAPLCPTL